MKYTSYLLAISVIVICCACGQQKSETTDNNAVTENLTDFAKFEQYAQWTTNIEYIKADEFDSLFWASIEKKRDTEMLLKVVL